jgi:hypothetical protein
LASVTLQDPKVNKLLKRRFVAVVVDIDHPPREVRAMLNKVEGKTLPFLLYITDRGQFLRGTSGGRTPMQLAEDLEQVLADKSFALTKARAAEAAKQVQGLEKALDAKNYKQASTAFQAALRVCGYGAVKDKAHDLMDAAQADGNNQLADAMNHAKKDEFAEAQKLASAVAKDFAGLPVADEAKQHQAALKLLEAAHRITTDKKGNWKPAALQRLNTLLAKYPDTPYAGLALRRRAELQKK